MVLEENKTNRESKKANPSQEVKLDYDTVEIMNMKIDAVILKILEFCWGFSKVPCLRLVRNDMSEEIEEKFIELISNPNFKLPRLYLEWNSLKNTNNYAKM